MKLYSVNYKGPLSCDTWSIVTIHKTYESANKAMTSYMRNWSSISSDQEYTIYVIDTDIDSDIIYDYEEVTKND